MSANAFYPPPSFGGEGTNLDSSHCITRDRSYSDAHCLFQKKSNDVAFKTLTATDQDVNDGASSAKVHHGNRPRSKSESEYRPAHHLKKKHSHGKQSSGTQPHHGPRPCSPKNLAHPTSCGKMWIRPVPLRYKTGRSSPHSKYESPLMSGPHVRQVSQSPPDEAEMEISIPMLYASPSSSFDACMKEKPVVAFGESGKPIKPIALFRHDSPTETTSVGVNSVHWQC